MPNKAEQISGVHLFEKPRHVFTKLLHGVDSFLIFEHFALILANPDIEDPDRVEVGRTVSLPAIPADVKPWDTSVWWVIVAETDSLQDAYNILRM